MIIATKKTTYSVWSMTEEVYEVQNWFSEFMVHTRLNFGINLLLVFFLMSMDIWMDSGIYNTHIHYTLTNVLN